MSPTTSFVILRHGETEWNLAERLQGHRDSPLTPRGLAQARAAAESLRNESYNAFYTSDLERALHTSRIIADRIGQHYLVDRRLREQNLGLLQGLNRQEARSVDPGFFESLRQGDADYRPRGGESRRERHQRAVSVLTELAERHPEGRILVITHGGIVESLFREALGIPLESDRRYTLYNAAINRFRYDGEKWFLTTWGDAAHLRSVGTTDAGKSHTAA